MTVQRKAGVVTGFSVLVLLLVQDVRDKVPAVESILQDLAGPAIERIPLDPGLSTALMVVVISAAAATLAMLAGRRGPGLLAIMTAAVLTWLTFPFARLSWLSLLVGGQVTSADPGVTTWLITGGLVALASFEAIASTRERLIADLRARGVPRSDLRAVESQTVVTTAGLLVLIAVLAVPAALAAAGAFGDLGIDVRVNLVLAPAIIGAIIGAYLWWAARSGSTA